MIAPQKNRDARATDDFHHLLWALDNKADRNHMVVLRLFASRARNGRRQFSVDETVQLMRLLGQVYPKELARDVTMLCRKASPGYADMHRFTALVTTTKGGKYRLKLVEKK